MARNAVPRNIQISRSDLMYINLITCGNKT
jgi:hypothetical protein